MSDLGFITLLAMFGGVLSLAGGIIFLMIPRWSKSLLTYSVPFSAGVLLTTALIGLIPEAYHMTGEVSYLFVLVSFFAAYVFEQFFFALHHHEPDDGHTMHHHVKESSNWLVVMGDSIHNWIDGVAIGAAFLVQPSLAVATAISTFLHEVPHEIGDFGILLKSGWSRRKVIMINLISALLTVGGAVMVLVTHPPDKWVGKLLAIAAGLFLYLGASDFLPQLKSQNAQKNMTIALFVGVIIMFVTLELLGH